MKKGTKTLLIILGCIAAAAIVFLIVKLAGKGKKNTKLTFLTETVEPGRITKSVDATGTIEPIKEVSVGTQVSGIIDKIYVDYNSVVKKGQLLAELDRSVLQQEVESSKASLNSSKASFEYQESNYNRQKGLYDKGLIAASDYESAQSSYLSSKYQYAQSQSAYQKAVKNLSYAWIYSPIDGVVLSRAVDEGQTVAAGFSTPTLFTIAQDLKKMQVVADVDEADIGQVKAGQNVDFTVDAFPDQTFKGSVTQVRLLATTTSNVVTYEVVIDAPNPDLILMPGLTANVTIYIMDKDSVLTVPQKALIFTPDGYPESQYDKAVWVMKQDGTLQNIQVKTGVTDGIKTEITEGINAGDRVVIGTSVNSQSQKAVDTSKQSGSSSPFMPKRPNGGNNVRTK